MREYGGFLGLEQNTGRKYHEGAIALNLGRNCLRYLIKARKIKKIWMPKFLCESVRNACKAEGIEIGYYSADENLRPVSDAFDALSAEDYFYLVNFYGFLSQDEIAEYASKMPHLIVDNTQAFFQKSLPGIDTIYSCRKFFGVPDGAYLYTDAILDYDLPVDVSRKRMSHLLGRYEGTASDFYEAYRENEDTLAKLPVMAMSKLTHNLMRGIDYDRARDSRAKNYGYLRASFSKINKLRVASCVPDGPFMYPLLVENGGEVRKKLQEQKIYVPTLWPNVLKECGKEDTEYRLAENILPLPVDQRYNLEDMKYVEEVVLKCIG